MHFKSVALLGASAVLAQRPANETICDYYTGALLKNNTAANQYTLLALLVNTAVIGNYTQPNHNAVPGILAPGTYDGESVNLLPYFDGCLESSNVNDVPTAVNWLDGGGAAPLKLNKPANDTTSHQYMLLTHLYQFVGKLIGCSGYGTMDFPSYQGVVSQYSVHKYMDLSNAELGYFIEQVGLSALSFGVSKEDATAAGGALMKYFGYKCSPAVDLGVGGGAALDSICIGSGCMLDPNATCSAYPMNGTGVYPMSVQSAMCMAANSTAPMASSSAMASTSATMSGMPSTYTGGASTQAAGWLSLAGLAALLL